jgi:DNA replication protein DnaC
MSDTPQLLLAHHLKALKLPTFLREYDKIAQQCAAEGVDHPRYLLRLAELELIERGRRMVERRIKEARFPTVKSLDSFDFTAIPSLNKTLVLELARCEYIARRENVIAVGNSGTGKSHIALGLGLAACQKGLSVGFTTAAAMVHELIEARDEKRLLRLQRQLAAYKLLIIDELGYVPLSTTGAELLFEVFSQRYERGSTLVTSNLPFDEWTGVFGSERLTGALLDRLTHHVRILEMNGDSYRLSTSSIGTGRCRPARRWRSALWAVPRGCGAATSRTFPDIGGYGNHEYGNRVGIFRILAVLDMIRHHADPGARQGGRRPLPVPDQGGTEARRRVHRARPVAPAHHPHRHVRGRGAASISATSIAAVEQATGKRPVGWSGPDFQETPNTPDLLAAEGIRYVCDWGNDEQPYKMTPKTGELYSLGVNSNTSTTTTSTCTAGARSTRSTCCGASGSTVSMPTARPPDG